jgi:crossover junction endodeoxyribonuclease RuvC
MTLPPAVLGIDPGLQGALVTYRPGKSPVIYDMPLHDGKIDVLMLSKLIYYASNNYPGIVAALEQVQGRPRQAGVFGFATGYGMIQGCLASSGIPFVLAIPNKWKPAMGLARHLDESQAAYKTRSRFKAAIWAPECAGQFARVKDDGRAEALLLAIYYAQKLGLNVPPFKG